MVIEETYGTSYETYMAQIIWALEIGLIWKAMIWENNPHRSSSFSLWRPSFDRNLQYLTKLFSPSHSRMRTTLQTFPSSPALTLSQIQTYTSVRTFRVCFVFFRLVHRHIWRRYFLLSSFSYQTHAHTKVWSFPPSPPCFHYRNCTPPATRRRPTGTIITSTNKAGWEHFDIQDSSFISYILSSVTASSPASVVMEAESTHIRILHTIRSSHTNKKTNLLMNCRNCKNR